MAIPSSSYPLMFSSCSSVRYIIGEVTLREAHPRSKRRQLHIELLVAGSFASGAYFFLLLLWEEPYHHHSFLFNYLPRLS